MKEMNHSSTTLEGTSLNEPPTKVARKENGIKMRDEHFKENSNRVTLFIRCAQIHGRGELMNGFLVEHREALGIQPWYIARDNGSETESAMVLCPDAPVECVFVKTSRKPYFLLECTESEGTAKAFVEKLIDLNNTTYKDNPVIVEVAKEGLTVSGERKKLELRDAVKRKSSASGKTPATTFTSRPPTASSFIPRVLRPK
ncbi:hypothetical protein TcYC6_0062260 [Trypanosoma cruzi]|uniref:Uncharacterized protein n=1 Tax=Trypanosoma cruzi (strain CL Brener) TaxID=353153 RepID=Q4DF97_TRYCC|nr:hypothetical protein, conserved [Trypanosoma cruzi]EAN91200.1 hypothetical protein, conserved [Trypanosoma cruzi]KAF8300086.1 hypothetical protein TcYC6_0062260 [Trypanosoma cruzi]RNC56897.1 hypothetical protein TcCL_ESM05532 [Trypanosoma cruzi]|eukprot:XP_813051.1 hypothetical protein [Trypanosoma cruzi strain CL Brener]